MFVKLTTAEVRKLLVTGLFTFFVLLHANVIRMWNESIVTIKLGAEIQGFIRLYCALPISILLILLYSKLSDSFSQRRVFQISYTFFSLLFLVFFFLLLPFSDDFLITSQWLDEFVAKFPSMEWIAVIIKNWMFVIFYSCSDLWPTFSYSVLAWQCINQNNSYKEAKRFYSYYNFFGQISLLFSSLFTTFIISLSFISSNFFKNLASEQLHNIVAGLSTSIIVLIVLALHHYITRSDRNDNIKLSNNNSASTTELLKLFKKSPTLRNISYILFSYGLTAVLIHLVWISQIRIVYSKMEDFLEFQSYLNYFSGGITLLFIVAGHYIISKFSWKFASLITPTVVFIPGLLFFILLIIKNNIVMSDNIIIGSNITITLLAVYIGAMQYVCVRGVKYSVFDITKEMKFVSLDKNEKSKGKAIADLLGFKLGKIIAAIVHSFGIIFFVPLSVKNFNNSYSDSRILYYYAIIFSVTCIIWIRSVYKLDKLASSQKL